ncbi:MAG TPA: DUF1674 domain-containing protein [Methylocystis sp.]|nr:DUF1674 domain-containing protein [Methylocystis sp.]
MTSPKTEPADKLEKDAPREDVSRSRPLSPAARRALAEAQERRRASVAGRRIEEIGGPGGPEPTRYGDWERKGIASDF